MGNGDVVVAMGVVFIGTDEGVYISSLVKVESSTGYPVETGEVESMVTGEGVVMETGEGVVAMGVVVSVE